jgi:cobalamin synthase
VRTAGRIFGAVAIFLTPVAAVYWFASYERAGTILLLAGAAFAGMVAACLVTMAGAPGPEDRPGAEMAEGTGDLGWFPTASIWPAGTGAGAVLLALGLAFGVWLALVGAALFVASVLGYALADRPRHPSRDAST